jgi:transcriptional regulator with XRE-family HTH domain
MLGKMPFSSKAASDATQLHEMTGETRCEALGRFLRERREALAPERVGIASHRSRRTPGLRREEVAFLADIGVKWYARLESGEESHPSIATLTSVAAALQLSPVELEYMLNLAGLGQPSLPFSGINTPIPASLEAFSSSVRGVAVTVGDRILTPFRWNAISDALHGHSRFQNPLDRNALVRSLSDPEIIAYLGPDRERFVFCAVGMFRLNYSSQTPSPLASEIYEKIKDIPLFQAAWRQRIVAAEMTTDSIIVRNHATVGRLAMNVVDFTTSLRSDLTVRSLNPADEETARKFALLETIGQEPR